jgi:hypothetical protein
VQCDALRQSCFDGGADTTGHVFIAEEIVNRHSHRILRNNSHADNVLVSREELRLEGLRAAGYIVSKVSPDYEPLKLPDLKLVDTVDGPGKGHVDAGHNPRVCDRPEPRNYRLLIGPNDEDAAEDPQQEQ